MQERSVGERVVVARRVDPGEEQTAAEVRAADCTVLTVDATDPSATVRWKLRTSLSVLDAKPEVVALTRVDAVDGTTVEKCRALVDEMTDAGRVVVSAVDGTGVETLTITVCERLPTERATLSMPAGDRAMQVVSTAYDRPRVHEVEYGDRVRLTVSGRPAAVERLRGRAPSRE